MASGTYTINPQWTGDTVPVVTTADLVNAVNANASAQNLADKVGFLKQELIDKNVNATATPATIGGGTTHLWNWTSNADNSHGTNASIKLGGSFTLSLANVDLPIGGYAAIRIEQSANGNCSISFSSNFKGVSDFSPSLDANAADWLLFRALTNTGTRIVELVGFRNNVGV